MAPTTIFYLEPLRSNAADARPVVWAYLPHAESHSPAPADVWARLAGAFLLLPARCRASLAAVAYVERNPVRAGLVAEAGP